MLFQPCLIWGLRHHLLQSTKWRCNTLGLVCANWSFLCHLSSVQNLCQVFNQVVCLLILELQDYFKYKTYLFQNFAPCSQFAISLSTVFFFLMRLDLPFQILWLNFVMSRKSLPKITQDFFNYVVLTFFAFTVKLMIHFQFFVCVHSVMWSARSFMFSLMDSLGPAILSS